jgi:AbrB family looped-hinge helix DNA binding protein
MTPQTISPKFQVVIPKDVRESMGLKAGTKVQVFQFDGRIEIVPIKPMREMRGFARGISTEVLREKDRL